MRASRNFFHLRCIQPCLRPIQKTRCRRNLRSSLVAPRLFSWVFPFSLPLPGYFWSCLLLYQRSPQLPQQIAQAFGGFYQTVLHKYYVDEIYAAVFVKPLIKGSTLLLWHGIDRDVIDATIDNSAEGANHVSDAMRHMQSGNLRSYAGWIAAGAAVVIAYMIWMGTQ